MRQLWGNLFPVRTQLKSSPKREYLMIPLDQEVLCTFSDLEINRGIAWISVSKKEYNPEDRQLIDHMSDRLRGAEEDHDQEFYPAYNPCDNWGIAGRIIELNNIDIRNGYEEKGIATALMGGDENYEFWCTNKNIKRAAMEVLLMVETRL